MLASFASYLSVGLPCLVSGGSLFVRCGTENKAVSKYGQGRFWMMMKKVVRSVWSWVVSLTNELDFLLNSRAPRVVPIYVRCADKRCDSTRKIR
jgi:hypothetical protein